MTDYNDLPEAIKQNKTEEEWNALFAELAEASQRARELMQHHG